MTTPPYQPGPYGQQDPYGQQSGGGFGQYGQQRPPEQSQYGGQGAFGNSNDQTQQLGGPTPAQPPYGGQYGATQQWQQGGPQYGGGFGGMPPEPPKKKTGMIIALVVIGVLVVGGAAVGIYFATKDKGSNSAGGETTTSAKSTGSSEEDTTTEDTTTEETTEGSGDAIDAQPGDCIKVNVASSTNADVETVDCSSDEAIYKVATREETDTGDCPNEQYVSYTEEGQLLLCLQLNVREGDCLNVSDSEDKRVDCTSADATDKVLKVIDGVDDETQCPDTTVTPMTYPQPPLTICLGSPTG
jgi:hypothetical protein